MSSVLSFPEIGMDFFFHFNITGFSGLEILKELIVMGNFEK